MKRPFLPVHKILVATFAGISFASLLVAQPSLADLNQPLGGLESERNTNFSGNGSDFNMFNLIHQANFGTLNWNPDQQNQKLDDAAAAFKARQEKLIQGQQRQNPSSTLTTSGENTPSRLLLPSDK
ncbi:hypothetical protein H6G54_16595 [Anabaena cylindrica FACHB-243]|uniref:Uncharacterized protein n=1 Tax=Anabaena cylindrica (strain ATCC 27899 / PCC 7122) TaxID=272123 RepID=K9ZHH8_ANACC|nr:MULTISPECIES: hypothetical protein [Anabaena]AFZ57800.1 hypothetical protein Anacy_2344 [Anabaena cylindrica PCC 7122]MBD2419290.1 hypothetical protein [Anabaena cylindrica FACHB-243]MBY5281358.1 hypothetical protein [Anabaena sp. CCAP 1446/1C]MBY5308392.1 hypothetical protein [Anabaena sp. CCAP 1446/1C]MCM2408108.1 hypothetical protein [Anabaena sp. CCAP 1446/1C]